MSVKLKNGAMGGEWKLGVGGGQLVYTFDIFWKNLHTNSTNTLDNIPVPLISLQPYWHFIVLSIKLTYNCCFIFKLETHSEAMDMIYMKISNTVTHKNCEKQNDNRKRQLIHFNAISPMCATKKAFCFCSLITNLWNALFLLHSLTFFCFTVKLLAAIKLLECSAKSITFSLTLA